MLEFVLYYLPGDGGVLRRSVMVWISYYLLFMEKLWIRWCLLMVNSTFYRVLINSKLPIDYKNTSEHCLKLGRKPKKMYYFLTIQNDSFYCTNNKCLKHFKFEHVSIFVPCLYIHTLRYKSVNECAETLKSILRCWEEKTAPSPVFLKMFKYVNLWMNWCNPQVYLHI